MADKFSSKIVICDSGSQQNAAWLAGLHHHWITPISEVWRLSGSPRRIAAKNILVDVNFQRVWESKRERERESCLNNANPRASSTVTVFPMVPVLGAHDAFGCSKSGS